MTEQAEKSHATDSTTQSSVTLSGLKTGLLGIKAGMTQVYSKDGASIPVTVIDLRPNIITQVKTQNRDGYIGVQVGMLPCKSQRVSKAEKGHFKKSGNPGYYHVVEFRTNTIEGLKEGQTLSVDFFKEGDFVDISAESKGKGFQGVMKRYNFAGGYKSHGASVCHRSPGSIGNRADPGRVFPGKKMAGHMGAKQVTIQNLLVIGVDRENNTLIVKGSIPGPKSGVVTIKQAIKMQGESYDKG